MADVVKQGWERYLYYLQRYPLRTKAITSGVLAGSSDCLAQKIAGAKTLEFRRAFYLALYGLLYIGPLSHYYHIAMDKFFAGKKDGETVVKKVVFEQLTWSPWNNALYMCFIGLVIEGKSWSSILSQLQANFPSVQMNSLKFWPVIGVLNYRFVPTQLRVLFVNLAAVCWANYMKWRVLSMANKRPAPVLTKAL